MGKRQKLRGSLLAGVILTAPCVAHADPITLKAKGGDVEISGELISTDGKTVAVNSPTAGLVILETKRFDCVGAGCSALATSDNFSIQGSNTIGAALMPALIESYAASQNLQVEKRVGASPEEVGIDLLTGSGKKIP